MNNFENINNSVKLEGDDYYNLYLTIYKKYHEHLPLKVHRGLKWQISKFLVLYPLPNKKLKVYEKLKEDKKLSFLIRYMIGTAYKEKVPSYLIDLYKKIKTNTDSNKNLFDRYHAKIKEKEDENINTYIKLSFSLHEYEVNKKTFTELLTHITVQILNYLFEKRVFMLNNNPYHFIQHLIEKHNGDT